MITLTHLITFAYFLIFLFLIFLFLLCIFWTFVRPRIFVWPLNLYLLPESATCSESAPSVLIRAASARRGSALPAYAIVYVDREAVTARPPCSAQSG